MTLITTVAASGLAVVLAWATESVSDDIGVANIGLILALVCVAAAMSDWFAGSVTSLFAALSLNFFHTTPVHSLRINEGEELATVLLLLCLGAFVSAATAVRLRRRASASARADRLAAQGMVRDVLRSGGPALSAWHAALSAANPPLGLVDVQLLDHVPPGFSLIARRSDDDADVVLPEAGAVIALSDESGKALLVKPRQGSGSQVVPRRTLMALVDQLTASLDGTA
ncbi:MAG: DUF4118 domain-containing protein [Acidobacteria bacterium]|nr:DUF4118 domain-containing protein [Acidobacteriota bacterium]